MDTYYKVITINILDKIWHARSIMIYEDKFVPHEVIIIRANKAPNDFIQANIPAHNHNSPREVDGEAYLNQSNNNSNVRNDEAKDINMGKRNIENRA